MSKTELAAGRKDGQAAPKSLKTARIAGMGISLPDKVVTNKEIEKLVDTSHEWIVERTGIVERRIAPPEIATSDLCVEAAQRALKDAGMTAAELDLILVCTVTPDMVVPATACLVQDRLGAKKAGACDISAGCTGFMYGLAIGSQFVSTGLHEKVMVIGADMLSRITDWKDRTTCVLFGDGAGAVILTPTDKEGHGLLNFHLRSDGGGGEFLKVEAGGSRIPTSPDTVQNAQHYLRMEGRQVFKFAVNAILDGVKEVLAKEKVDIEEVDCFLFHQANLRIIENAAKQLKIPMEKIFTNVDRYGNTSSASVPLALIEAREQKRFKEGSYVVMVGFGAGLTWASSLVRW